MGSKVQINFISSQIKPNGELSDPSDLDLFNLIPLHPSERCHPSLLMSCATFVQELG